MQLESQTVMQTLRTDGDLSSFVFALQKTSSAGLPPVPTLALTHTVFFLQVAVRSSTALAGTLFTVCYVFEP